MVWAVEYWQVAKSILEIAIYRVGERHFEQQFEKDLEAHLAALEKRAGISIRGAPPPRILHVSKERFRESYGGPWRYNQVIGWLRLHAGDFAVLGDLWLCDAKHFQRRMVSKRFFFEGTEVILHRVEEDLSSSEIFTRIQGQLNRYHQAWRSRGFTMDLACLEDLGHFIDWRSLLRKAGSSYRAPHELVDFGGTRLAIK